MFEFVNWICIMEDLVIKIRSYQFMEPQSCQKGNVFLNLEPELDR